MKLGKPHPEPFILGAKRIGLEPNQCWVIEDAPAEVKSGKSAGCTVAAVLTSHVKEQLDEAVEFFINYLPQSLDSTSDTDLLNIKDDPNKLMAHIYVRHMGDLSGGQMIAKRTPGSGTMYQFDEDVGVIKDRVREKLDDSMAEEAKICFDFATQLFQEMSI